MSGKPYWDVSVRVDGDTVITIDCNGSLAGVSDIERYADQVREAGQHLLAFIGDGKPMACFLCGGLEQLEQCEPDCPSLSALAHEGRD